MAGRAKQRARREARERAGLAPQRAGFWWRGAVVVAVVAAVVYANGIPGEFVFDDKLIQRDARIRDFAVATIFTTDYWGGYAGSTGDLYRPLTIFSYALNAAITGLHSPSFHAVNVLLHAAVCVLLLFLMDALFASRALALATALLFAAHPVHTEAVTGIVGRAEILTALFLLGSLLVHARRQPLWRLPGSGTLGLGLGSYFLALLSKETAIVGIGLLALVDAILLLPRPASDRQRCLRPVLATLALYVGVALLYLCIRYAVLGALVTQPPKRPGLLFDEPLGTRLATVFEILAINLKLLFWPVTLSADYSYDQVPVVSTVDGVVAVGIVAALVLVAALVRALQRRDLPTVFAIGFFAVSYAVVSNLVPIGVLVAERLLYLPSVGFCCGVAWVGVRLLRRLEAGGMPLWLRHLPTALFVLVLVLYGARTMARNLDWRDAETLYRATTVASPNCHNAHFNYAAIVMKRSDPESNEEALRHLERAMQIHQRHFPAYVNLANIYLRLGRFVDARDTARRGLEHWPKSKNLETLLEAAEAQIAERDAPATR